MWWSLSGCITRTKAYPPTIQSHSAASSRRSRPRTARMIDAIAPAMKRHPDGVRGSTNVAARCTFDVAVCEPRIRACVTKTPCQICGSALRYAMTINAMTAAKPAGGHRSRRASGPVPQRRASAAIGSAAVSPGSFTEVAAARTTPEPNAAHARNRPR